MVEKTQITLWAVMLVLFVQVHQVQAFTPDRNLGVDTSKLGTQTVDVFGLAIDESANSAPNFERPRRALSVEKGYNGYMIQVVECYNKPLGEEHTIFDRHGKIRMQRIDGDTYKYFICETERLSSLVDVFEKSIKPQYKNAKVVRFDNGIIVETVLE